MGDCARGVRLWFMFGGTEGALMQGERAWGQLMRGNCTMLFPQADKP